MTSPSASPVQDGTAAFAVCEAAALATRTHALLTVLRGRLDAFAGAADGARRLDVEDLERLRAIGEEVAELASQVALVIDGLPLGALDAGDGEIAAAARAALAEGIVDHRRALTAARLLNADEGLPALAEALVGSDAHAYWDARVVDVLAAFRDVDQHRARRLARSAGVPEAARFSELRPERVLVLAQVARQHVAR